MHPAQRSTGSRSCPSDAWPLAEVPDHATLAHGHGTGGCLTDRAVVRYSLRVTERRRDLLSLATLSLAALILGHHLVFLTAYGPQYWTMLERTGHGPVWAITVATVAILSAGLAFLALRRLASLGRLARAVEDGGTTVRDGSMRHLAALVLRVWCVILVASLALFVLNENMERAAIGLPAPGIAILAGGIGHTSPIFVFMAVAAAVALVAGLYRWRRDVLLARVGVDRPTWDRSAHARPPRPSPLLRRRPRSVVGSRLAGRAPPPLPRLSTI